MHIKTGHCKSPSQLIQKQKSTETRKKQVCKKTDTERMLLNWVSQTLNNLITAGLSQQSNRSQRANSQLANRRQVMIGFTLSSDWLREWCKFFLTNHRAFKSKTTAIPNHLWHPVGNCSTRLSSRICRQIPRFCRWLGHIDQLLLFAFYEDIQT